jgi:uncharacterized RDD family membrane protein YckC
VTQPPSNYPPPGYPPPGYAPPQNGYAVPHQYAPPVYRPKPTGPGGAPLAEFGERLLAYFLDGLILGAILLIPMVVCMAVVFVPYVQAIDSVSRGGNPDFAPILLTFLGVFVAIFGLQVLSTYLYRVTYQLRTGQTVGKRVMKLKIVNAADGSPLDLTGARKRWAVELGLGLLGPGGYLDGLWQLWDPQKQTLHDKVARTVVVKVPA